MKTKPPTLLLGVLLTFLFTSLPSVSQEAAPAPLQSGAKAVLSSHSHDFGTVARADIAETTFEITNEGTEALVIRDVQTSCACAVVELDRTIEPGEKGEIKVSVDTDFIDGTYQATVALYTNDPEQPRIDLTLEVETTPYLYAEPGYVRYRVHQNFPGDGAVRQLVFAKKPTDFKILRLESTLSQVKTSFWEVPEEQRDERHDGAQWVVETRLDKDAPVGTMGGWLRIYTDHPKQSKASIPVSGHVRPVFAVTPHEADFGSLDPGMEGYAVRPSRARQVDHLGHPRSPKSSP